MENLFGEVVLLPLKSGKPGKSKTNPLIRVYGPGPAGAKCAGCIHQFFKRYASTYSKCELRGNTGGPATDHSSRYSACGKYEAKPRKEDAATGTQSNSTPPF